MWIILERERAVYIKIKMSVCGFGHQSKTITAGLSCQSGDFLLTILEDEINNFN